MNIAVIGAGITGLTAAYDLSRAGHRVEVFERSGTIGGLAAGFETHGTHLEQAYHHLFTTDTAIIGLAEELGIGDKLMWSPSSMALYADGAMHPFTGPLDLLRFSPLGFWDRLRLGIVTFCIQNRKGWRSLVDVPAIEWMRWYCGERVFEVVWKPILVGKFHQHHEHVSMAWLWARLHSRVNSRGQSAMSQEKLGYFAGGFHTLIRALTVKLEARGVILSTGMPIQSLRHDAATGQILVQVEGRERTFDRAICAVPSYVFAGLIQHDTAVTAADLAKLRSTDYLDALCLVFTSSQSLSPYYWHTVADLDYPFLSVIQHTNFVPKEHYMGEHVYYLGAYVPREHRLMLDSPEVTRQRFFAGLQGMFPSFDASKVTECHVFRFRDAQHVPSVGYLGKMPSRRTPVPGVFLSNFSQIFPEDRGTNFAVAEGRAVAQLCMAS